MDVFALQEKLIKDYAEYAGSFIQIKNQRLRTLIDDTLQQGTLWPESLIQLNPTFQSGGSVQDLVTQGTLHPGTATIFRKGKQGRGLGTPLVFHQHQVDAIRVAKTGAHYVLTTGTGSGKSLSYIVPIVDHVLRKGSSKGIQAIIVYPMNALANSQLNELRKFLDSPESKRPLVTFARYTGQESEIERRQILENPPDILLTNYVMLELIMTRPRELPLLERAAGLQFLVVDELHTYRGRQGSDVALLMRRVRDRLDSGTLQFVGTSATLATEGSYGEIRQRVADVASQIFGVKVEASNVIGETLSRSTAEYASDDLDFQQALQENVTQIATMSGDITPQSYESFVAQPLSRWIEATFGVTLKEGRLVRSTPRGIRGQDGAAAALSLITGISEAHCEEVIRRWLLAGYQAAPHPVTGFKPFAFRLHQFLSPADTMYATLEPEDTRYITLQGQKYAPGGDREKLLLPLCFCRECGQEYYPVWFDESAGTVQSRLFRDLTSLSENEAQAGYLYLNSENPWPDDIQDAIQSARLPDDWCEEYKGGLRVKRSKREDVPRVMRLNPDGTLNATGLSTAFVPAPFNFCLQCGVAYAPRQGEFTKLASLNSEGRSSATTILSLSAILQLRVSDLADNARKMLSFTDNRQDASLQAGHFNDFIEMGLLRGAIYQAALHAGEEGLHHKNITQAVFESLNLPLDLYASNATVRFQALQDTQESLREVLGYRIYRDLRRGWRITSPNLEPSEVIDP